LEKGILEIISKGYQENFEDLQQLFRLSNSLSFGISSIPQYKDLEWRLDVEVDRRSIREISNPVFTCKLNTNQGDILFSSQYLDLKHVCDVLEQALKESRSTHVRRIRKYIK
jgi:COMM domain containing 2